MWALLLLSLLPALAGAQTREISLTEAQDKEVRSIRFVHLGDRPFKNDDLRAAMLQTREGKPFQRRFFRNDLSVLEDLYRGAGYMEVSISGKDFHLEDEKHLRLTIRIDSGARWQVADVRLAASGPCDTTALRQQLKLAPGEAYRYGQVVQDERALQTFLNRRGYAHASVQNQYELDARQHRARVVYRIDPGRRMYFSEVRIIGGDEERPLHTRPALVRRYLSFRQGDLYDPELLKRTRNELVRTGLFRAVTLTTPPVAPGDSLQPVEIHLQEKRYLHLEGNAFLNITSGNAEPGLTANLQHGNWLGRGTRIGLDAGLGKPLQGSTLYLTARDLVHSGADLTLSAGLTDEWGTTRVFADPEDSLQFALLTANDSVLNGLLLFAGPEAVSEIISISSYRYPSVERLYQFTSTLSRIWTPRPASLYHADLSVAWNQSRARPVDRGIIDYNSELDSLQAAPDTSDTSFGDDPFGDDDPFGNDDPFGESSAPSQGEPPAYLDYSDGQIPIDRTWQQILTDRANTLNFTLRFQRDTRDDPLAPSRGLFLRAKVLYAIQFGGQDTRVLDTDGEIRHYLPLGRGLVWAQAMRGGTTASLRQGRALPRVYWKEYGGEGSVRGVALNSIQAIGGGRVGFNLRNELRFAKKDFGLVLFWDLAGVWRHARQVSWSGMKDGYGVGLRYTLGIPFRLDLAWSGGLATYPGIYFSIGQAF